MKFTEELKQQVRSRSIQKTVKEVRFVDSNIGRSMMSFVFTDGTQLFLHFDEGCEVSTSVKRKPS